MSFENERKHSWSFVPGLVFTIATSLYTESNSDCRGRLAVATII
jgi:hypothetical protein